MTVPGVGLVHKSTVCAWFASGTENVSADRGMRATQSNGSNQQHHRFNVNQDEWLVGIGDDIAVKCDEKAWLGRIYRMRKRYANKRWADYVYDVNILTEKTNTGTMFFDVCWYKKRAVRPGSAHQNTYAYGKAASQEIALATVICPVTLTYSEQHCYYPSSGSIGHRRVMCGW